MCTELTPKYEKVKSYYGKARVWDKEGVLTLESYGVTVLQIDKDSGLMRKVIDNKHLSNTTMRHAKEFLWQFYFRGNNEEKRRKVNMQWFKSLRNGQWLSVNDL